MKLKILLVITIALISTIVLAQTKLTLSKLELQNYKQMTGIEISELLLNKTVKLKDLLSEAVYEIKINQDGSIKKYKIITQENPKTLTSVDYHSRASLLTEFSGIAIKGNKIISTDGVRTYISTLYKKGDIIYGVRDIDHEIVNFQIIIKK